MMRLDGVLSASGGTPGFHIDFEQKGIIVTGSSDPTHTNATINRQSQDFDSVRSSVGHAHFHMVFMVLATSEMVASGGQFYGAVAGSAPVTFASATLMIKEG